MVVNFKDQQWEELLSEKMQELGYRVGLFGKWHCTTNSAEPQRGFDKWLSYGRLGHSM